jgi:hypothetical protein
MGAIWFKSGASWQWGELTWICEVNMKPARGLSCCIGTTVLSTSEKYFQLAPL